LIRSIIKQTNCNSDVFNFRRQLLLFFGVDFVGILIFLNLNLFIILPEMEFRQSVSQSDVSSTATTSTSSIYIDPSTQLLSDEWRRKANLMTMKEIVAALDPDNFGDDIFSDPTRAVPALPLPAFSLASPPPAKAPWASVTHSNVEPTSDARSYFTMSEPSAPHLHIATDFSPSPPASLPVSPAPAASRPDAWSSSGAPRPILRRAAVGTQQAKVNADLEGLAEHLKLVSSTVSEAVVNAAPQTGVNSFVARRHVVHEVPQTPAAAAPEPRHQFKSEEEMLLASMPAPPPGARPCSYRAARVVGTMGWLPTSDPRLPEAPKATPHNAVYDVNIANRLANWRTGGNQNSGAYVSVSRSDRFEEVRAGSKDVPNITPRTIDKHVHTRVLHEIGATFFAETSFLMSWVLTFHSTSQYLLPSRHHLYSKPLTV
jgi:hypothetical protein